MVCPIEWCLVEQTKIKKGSLSQKEDDSKYKVCNIFVVLGERSLRTFRLHASQYRHRTRTSFKTDNIYLSEINFSDSHTQLVIVLGPSFHVETSPINLVLKGSVNKFRASGPGVLG